MRQKSYMYSISQLKEQDFNVEALIEFISKINDVEVPEETEEFHYDYIKSFSREDKNNPRNNLDDLKNLKRFAGFLAIERIIWQAE